EHEDDVGGRRERRRDRPRAAGVATRQLVSGARAPDDVQIVGMTFRADPPRLFSFSLVLLSLVLLTGACASSSDDWTTRDVEAAAPDAPAPAPAAASCGSPKTGIYMVDLTPESACPWWDSTDARGDMRVLDDAVQYPHS